jgi:hypothetical protein
MFCCGLLGESRDAAVRAFLFLALLLLSTAAHAAKHSPEILMPVGFLFFS